MVTTVLARRELRIVDGQGAPIPFANIEVRVETSGRPPAACFSDRLGTVALGSQFNADENGRSAFHVQGGCYSIRVWLDGFSDEMRYVGIGTGQEVDRTELIFGPFDAYTATALQGDYDGMPEGFRLFLTDAFDGDGGWVVRNDDDPSGWLGPVPVRGPRGGDRYDFFIDDPDQPVSAEVIIKAPFTTLVTFPAGLAASKARCDVAPTVDATFSLQKNGVEFGTVVFPAGQLAGVFASAADTTFDPDQDDELTIVAPSPKDGSLRRPRMTISGYRPT